MKKLATRFGKFGLVGVLGAIIQLAAATLLVRFFRFTAVVATALAVEVAILHNLAWHERFTWRDRKGNAFERSCRFHAANGLVSFFGNTILVYWFCKGLNWTALESESIAIVACSAVNFWLADRWVWMPLSDDRREQATYRDFLGVWTGRPRSRKGRFDGGP